VVGACRAPARPRRRGWCALSDLLQLAGGLALAWLAWQHLVAPLAVYVSHRAHCEVELPDMPVERYLAELGEVARPVHDELLAIGFSPVVAGSLHMSSSDTRFAVYQKPGEPACANLMIGRNVFGEKTALEFTLGAADGTNLGVLDSPIPSVYPAWPRKRTYRVMGVPGAASLYAVLGRLRARHPGFVPGIPPSDRLLELARDFMQAETRHMVSIGFLKRDCDRRGRGLTLRGAYQASWKLTWPWRAISNWRARRLGRQLLAEAG
jgi:hypothetical protein